VIGHEGPGVESGAAFPDQGGESVEEIMAVVVGVEDLAAFDAADDNVVERTRVVETGAARHAEGGSPEAVYMSSSVHAGRALQSTRPTRPYVPKARTRLLWHGERLTELETRVRRLAERTGNADLAVPLARPLGS
jgi:hypothetical protein